MASSDSNNNDLYSSLPQDKWWGDRPLYKFHNYWFRLPYLQGIQQTLKEFKPLPTDIILASFPKTGTTWLKSLLYSIVNRSSKQSLTATHPHELVPSLELQVYGPNATTSIDQHNSGSNSRSRIFSTHIPYEILADVLNSSECKVVYVTRDPKDALVSLWHFIKHTEVFKEDPWPIDVAVDKFCAGVVPYGPFHEHAVGYQKQSVERPKKVFFVTYEELKKDTSGGVKRLGEFLGFQFDKEEVEGIVKICSIETLKSHEVNKSNELPSWFELPYNSFFRDGGVGDHKNHLSPEMIERIDAITKDKFHGSGFMFGI